MFLVLSIFLVSVVSSWLLGHAVHRLLLRYQIVDRPNQRSSHTRPTVRGGGIAIIATVLGVGLWLVVQTGNKLLLAVMGGALVLAAISFFDDVKSLRASFRFGFHVVVAFAVLLAVGSPKMTLGFSPDIGVPIPALAGALLGTLWIVGYTNAFNFMDGINGIAGGQAVLTGLGMAVLAAVAVHDFNTTPVLFASTVAGAALGFLPHNFPTARMFMGDVGSAPLGFLLSVLALWLATSLGFWLFVPLALLHANFVLDTGITLLRRIARGDKWHEAHREHFYQRLVRSGKSHAFVTGCEFGLQGVVLGLMLLYLRADVPVRVGLTVAVILLWLAFFAYCEISFRRHFSKKHSVAVDRDRLHPDSCVQEVTTRG